MLGPSRKMILPIQQGSDGLIPWNRKGEMILLLGPERILVQAHMSTKDAI